jgi:hypothetical protein
MAIDLDLGKTVSASFNLEKVVGQVVDKLTGWVITTIKMLPNLVVGIVILIFLDLERLRGKVS